MPHAMAPRGPRVNALLGWPNNGPPKGVGETSPPPPPGPGPSKPPARHAPPPPHPPRCHPSVRVS